MESLSFSASKRPLSLKKVKKHILGLKCLKYSPFSLLGLKRTLVFLESSKKRKVLVKNEFEFLQNYIDLEKIRLPWIPRALFVCQVASYDLSIPFLFGCAG